MRLADSQRAALLAPEAGGPRARHAATLLSNNGKVLVVGGTSGGGAVLATAELFQ